MQEHLSVQEPSLRARTISGQEPPLYAGTISPCRNHLSVEERSPWESQYLLKLTGCLMEGDLKWPLEPDFLLS